jgi:hypothetical protein
MVRGDETNEEKMLIMRDTQSSNNQFLQDVLLGIAMGYMIARTVHLATAETGIADLLNEGPVHSPSMLSIVEGELD